MEAFHITEYQKERQSEISAKRAEAGRKGAAATNAKRWGVNANGQQNQQTDFVESANQQSRLEEVVGVGVDVDVECNETTTTRLTHNTNSEETESVLSPSSSISKNETGKSKPPVKSQANERFLIPVKEGGNATIPVPKGKNNCPVESDTDLDAVASIFAEEWGRLMKHNPKFKRDRLPSKYLDIWTADFRALLDIYPVQTVNNLLIYSQSPTQQEYNFLTKTLREGAERNLPFMEALKKTSGWKLVRQSYQDIVSGETESGSSWDMEAEVDELALTCPYCHEPEPCDCPVA